MTKKSFVNKNFKHGGIVHNSRIEVNLQMPYSAQFAYLFSIIFQSKKTIFRKKFA